MNWIAICKERTNSFAKIKAFESKLRLWELQLRSNIMAHFPTLRTEKPTDTKKYAEEIQILQ
jgi:hypothetical protein